MRTTKSGSKRRKEETGLKKIRYPLNGKRQLSNYEIS
jgi:hypothetical protein